MDWNLTGQKVMGRYIGVFLCSGTVTESRVKYGGSVAHTVVLDKEIEVFGSVRDIVQISHDEIMMVNGVYL